MILGELSHEIVLYVEEPDFQEEVVEGEKYPWIKVRLDRTKTGYVFGTYARVSCDLEVCFEKKDGMWKISTMTDQGCD
jgi:hypothetical protein